MASIIPIRLRDVKRGEIVTHDDATGPAGSRLTNLTPPASGDGRGFFFGACRGGRPRSTVMQNKLLLGVACVCLGAMVFSVQDAIIKAVSGTYPVTQAMAIRAIVALPILLAMIGYEGGLASLVSKRWRLLLTRSSVMFVSYMAYYLAIAAIPLADVSALFFTTPLMILVMAGPYLGERVDWRTLLAALVGLGGVVIMLRPGAGVFDWAALLVLVSAALYAFGQLITRQVSESESATVMTFYQNGVYLVGSLALAGLFALTIAGAAPHPSVQFLTRPWVTPTLRDFLMMAACGVIAAVAMTLLSQAYRLAPANRVATFEYVGVIWGPLWGLLFFAEIPHRTTILGAALIVGAGLLALNAGRKHAPVLIEESAG